MNVRRPPPAILQTPGFAHYALAWSPFHTTRIALASAANFGLVGNGRLHLISLLQNPAGAPALKLDKQYDTQDGLYDVAWSEIHENQLVTASGDGSIKLWDVMLNDLPIRAWSEHTREVFSIDWSNIKKDTFASASWDGCTKLWTPDRPRSVVTLQAHHSCVYQALFSPHQPDIIATCSTDGTLKIFDIRMPSYAPSGPNTNNFTNPLSAAAITIPASGTEILTLDWNKYRPFILASAGVDKMIKIWDARMVKPGEVGAVGGICEAQLPGHEYAVRKVQWSPHRANILASASYDMTCRVTDSRWNLSPGPGESQLCYIHDPHTEFVVGCSWSLYDEGALASYAEDILLDSLETLYGYQPITLSSAGSLFVYDAKPTKCSDNSSSKGAGPIQIELSTTDTSPENWSLHASDIWVSSVFIADHLCDLGVGLLARADVPPQLDGKLHILELGAGAGLPSILIAKSYENTMVTVSDYPDQRLIETLSQNVVHNGIAGRCRATAHAWGSDVSMLLKGNSGFDVVIAADTLWNPDLHDLFVQTLRGTLRKAAHARVHLVAGLHTGRYTIQAFLSRVRSAGFEFESVVEKEVSGTGEREWDVSRAENEDEKDRRNWVVWMKLRWEETLINHN
ncbi:WD40-repeat-containing domain protein [Infundibulicybe gibba]|nr:WD40-repeat-containing domain protein [Infundibulicybe gibba]